MSVTAGSHYDVLGVPPDATDDDLRKAYRRRARETHPDTGGSAEQFSLVQLAYEVLRDPGQRETYDRSLVGETLGDSEPADTTFAEWGSTEVFTEAPAETYRREREERAAAQERATAAARAAARYHERGTLGPDGQPLTHAARVRVEIDALHALDPSIGELSVSMTARLRRNRAEARARAASARRRAPFRLALAPALLVVAALLVRLSGVAERYFDSPEGVDMRSGPLLVGSYYPMAGQYAPGQLVTLAVGGLLLAVSMWVVALVRSSIAPVRRWWGLVPVWVGFAVFFAACEHLFIHDLTGWALAPAALYLLWLVVLWRAPAPLSAAAWHQPQQWVAEIGEEMALFGSRRLRRALTRLAGRRGDALAVRLLSPRG